MKSPSLSHNSSQTDTFHKILSFWQRQGLQARKNPNSDHLEYFLSFPNREVVGRIFGFGDWIGIQTYSPTRELLPKLKTSSTELVGVVKIEYLFGLELMKSIRLPKSKMLFKDDGFIIFTGNLEAGKGGQK